MSRLVNTTTMTVDALTDVGAWFVSEGEHDTAARAQFDGTAGMVMGRPTYEGLAGYWTQETGPWADLLNPLPKYVASRTLHAALDWNAKLIEGDAGDEIARLKDELEGDLFLIGCGEFARYLLEKGLVDEAPVLAPPGTLGRGRASVRARGAPNATPRGALVRLRRDATALRASRATRGGLTQGRRRVPERRTS
jgi:dihydrofolate reductase